MVYWSGSLLSWETFRNQFGFARLTASWTTHLIVWSGRLFRFGWLEDP